MFSKPQFFDTIFHILHFVHSLVLFHLYIMNYLLFFFLLQVSKTRKVHEKPQSHGGIVHLVICFIYPCNCRIGFKLSV